jgi:capsular polysaccharide biosynthesis protein
LCALSAEGFYHFLLESLPRLYLARDYMERIKKILVNGTPGSFQEKWLRRAGVQMDKIVWMEGLSHYHCEQLLFTNHLIGDYRPDPWTIQALRELLSGHPGATPGHRRLWISRADALSRQPLWEHELLAELKDFESVNLARMDPGAQIELMKNASVVAAPHGAGLSNILFCAPGTQVVEIFPDTKRQPIYGRLAHVCGLDHAWAISHFGEKAGRLGESIRQFIGS